MMGPRERAIQAVLGTRILDGHGNDRWQQWAATQAAEAVLTALDAPDTD